MAVAPGFESGGDRGRELVLTLFTLYGCGIPTQAVSSDKRNTRAWWAPWSSAPIARCLQWGILMGQYT